MCKALPVGATVLLAVGAATSITATGPASAIPGGSYHYGAGCSDPYIRTHLTVAEPGIHWVDATISGRSSEHGRGYYGEDPAEYDITGPYVHPGESVTVAIFRLGDDGKVTVSKGQTKTRPTEEECRAAGQ